MVECTRLSKKLLSDSFILFSRETWRDWLHLGLPHQQKRQPHKNPLGRDNPLHGRQPTFPSSPQKHLFPSTSCGISCKTCREKGPKEGTWCTSNASRSSFHIHLQSTSPGHQQFPSVFPLRLLIPPSLPDSSPGFPKLEVGLIPPYSPKAASSPGDTKASNALIS